MDGMAKGEAAAVLTVEAGPVEASDHERAQIVVLLPARQVLANLLAPPNLLTLHGAMMLLVSETASAIESSIGRLPGRRTRRNQGRCTRHGLRCCWPSPSRSSASSGGLCGSHRRPVPSSARSAALGVARHGRKRLASAYPHVVLVVYALDVEQAAQRRPALPREVDHRASDEPRRVLPRPKVSGCFRSRLGG